MTDTLQAVLLGAIQGVTEFLPVSSSGHLLIARHLFDWDGFPFLFDILLHCATLLVIIHLLRHPLMKMLKSPLLAMRTHGIPILITTTITALIGVLIGRFVPIGHLRLTAAGYSFTAVLLAVSLLSFRHQRQASSPTPAAVLVNWKQAILIGLFQGIAVIPGISRAGSTILIARLCGVEKRQAFEYSFLVSIPAILGALLFQLLADPAPLSVSRSALVVGSAVAVVSGALCLRILRYLNMNDRIGIFLPYVLFLSFLCFIL